MIGWRMAISLPAGHEAGFIGVAQYYLIRGALHRLAVGQALVTGRDDVLPGDQQAAYLQLLRGLLAGQLSTLFNARMVSIHFMARRGRCA